MEGGGPDPRCYKVDCSKFWNTFPGFKTEWTVRRGAQEMYDAFVRHGLTGEQFASFKRLRLIQEHMAAGRIDASLRWQTAASAV
jgi:hypothetical protein